jgi:GNAT superfamily N-acetyltransferase
MHPSQTGASRRPLHQGRSLHFEEGAATLAKRLEKVVDIYCPVFNGVDGIEPPWTRRRAAQFMHDRTHRRGLVSLLLCEGERVVGACIGVLIPKADGVWSTDWDLLVHPDYRGSGLGRDLYYRAHQCAEKTALATFGERPAMIEFSTYRQPKFPKDWWLSLGHQGFPLFSASLKAPANGGVANDIAIREVQPGDVEGVASFMASPDVRDIDESRWSASRAALFLAAMLDSAASVQRLALAKDEIAGMITADLVMRRCGPVLTQLTLIYGRRMERQCSGLTALLLDELADKANRRSFEAYDMAITGLELTELQARRLRPVLPDVRQDEDFIGMSAPFETFMAAMQSRYCEVANRAARGGYQTLEARGDQGSALRQLKPSPRQPLNQARPGNWRKAPPSSPSASMRRRP